MLGTLVIAAHVFLGSDCDGHCGLVCTVGFNPMRDGSGVLGDGLCLLRSIGRSPPARHSFGVRHPPVHQRDDSAHGLSGEGLILYKIEVCPRRHACAPVFAGSGGGCHRSHAGRLGVPGLAGYIDSVHHIHLGSDAGVLDVPGVLGDVVPACPNPWWPRTKEPFG